MWISGFPLCTHPFGTTNRCSFDGSFLTLFKRHKFEVLTSELKDENDQCTDTYSPRGRGGCDHRRDKKQAYKKSVPFQHTILVNILVTTISRLLLSLKSQANCYSNLVAVSNGLFFTITIFGFLLML